MAAKVSRRRIAAAVAAELLKPGADHQDVMKALAVFLVEANLTHQSDMLMNDIAGALFALNGQLTVEVASAHELSEAELDRVRSYLSQVTGADTVDVYPVVEPDLLGGIVARTSGAELDASVRSKLRQLTAIA